MKTLKDLRKELTTEIEEDIDIIELFVYMVNRYDSGLEDMFFYKNDSEFFDMYFNNKLEAVRAVSFGKYNYCHARVKFNGYGNLITMTEHEYEKHLIENINYIVEESTDYIDRINELLLCTDLDDDIIELLKQIQELI